MFFPNLFYCFAWKLKKSLLYLIIKSKYIHICALGELCKWIMLELKKWRCSHWCGTIALMQPWIFFIGKGIAVPILFVFSKVLLFLSVWMSVYCILSLKHVCKTVRSSWLCGEFRRPKGCETKGGGEPVACWGTYEAVLSAGIPLSGKALSLCLNRKRKRRPIVCLLQNIWDCMRLLNCLWVRTGRVVCPVQQKALKFREKIYNHPSSHFPLPQTKTLKNRLCKTKHFVIFVYLGMFFNLKNQKKK